MNNRCTYEKGIVAPDALMRAGYSMMWPAWASVYSQRYSVFINPVKLYWTAAINKYFYIDCASSQWPYIITVMSSAISDMYGQTLDSHPAVRCLARSMCGFLCSQTAACTWREVKYVTLTVIRNHVKLQDLTSDHHIQSIHTVENASIPP
jgi:hypothetical protein